MSFIDSQVLQRRQNLLKEASSGVFPIITPEDIPHTLRCVASCIIPGMPVTPRCITTSDQETPNSLIISSYKLG